MLSTILVIIIIISILFVYHKKKYINTKPILTFHDHVDTSQWNTWQKDLVYLQNGMKNLPPDSLLKIIKSSVVGGLVLIKVNGKHVEFIKGNVWEKKYHDSRLKFLLSLITSTINEYDDIHSCFIACVCDLCNDFDFPVLSNLHYKKGTISFPHSWCHYFSGDKFPMFDKNEFDKVIHQLRSLPTTKIKNKVLFRGSTRFPHTTKRIRLWLHSLKSPKDTDVNFLKFTKPEDMIKYSRGIFSVRGIGLWTGATNRFFQSSKGVVFYIEEFAKDFVMLMLEPQVDYISIDTNLHNLDLKTKLVTDKELMNAISASCYKKVQNIFSADSLRLYCYHCLKSFELSS